MTLIQNLDIFIVVLAKRFSVTNISDEYDTTLTTSIGCLH